MASTTTDALSAKLLAELSTDTSRKRSGVAPVLSAFVASGELYTIVDTSVFPQYTPEELIQHFKNAGKATQHNVTLDCPEYKIPGGYHVLPKIVDGNLLLINQKVAERMKAEQS